MTRPGSFSRGAVPAVAVLLGLGVAMTGCGSSGGGATGAAPGATTPAGQATVATHSTPDGVVLTDAQGMTLYLLTADRPGHFACTAACRTTWPPVMVNGTPRAGGVSARLGTVTAPGGGRQLTVDGHPAYTYSGDSAPGQVNGVGLQSYGGTWWAIGPTGAPVRGGSSSSGSGGYSY